MRTGLFLVNSVIHLLSLAPISLSLASINQYKANSIILDERGLIGLLLHSLVGLVDLVQFNQSGCHPGSKGGVLGLYIDKVLRWPEFFSVIVLTPNF